MNITQEKIDELNAVLKIEVSPEDYSNKVEKTLKENQRKLNLPGFRPGKVPMTVVKKMVGKSVLVEEINKLVVDSMFEYIDQNKIEMLGNPLPNRERAKEVDWDTQQNFEFFYDMGLTPQFSLEPLDHIKADKYNIAVDEKVIEKYVLDIRKRYGKYSNPETSGPNDLVYAEFEELDEQGNVKEGGIKNKSSLALDLIKKENSRKKFLGLKKDETKDVDLVEAFGDAHEVSHILGVSEDVVKNAGKIYRMKVMAISRNELAEINEELFSKVYKSDNLKSIEELKDRIKVDAEVSFVSESDKRFVNDVVKNLMEKTKLSLPDAFLKRWLLESNREKFTAEQVEKEYKVYAETLKWQLIENRILKEYNIEVKEEEVRDYLKDYFRKSVKGEDGNEMPDDKLNEIADRMMKNREEMKRIYDKLYDDRITELFKANVKKKDVDISYEEFIKLAGGNNHHH